MSKKKLDFRIDEYVVYPAHGVGKVTAVDEQEVAGITLELFVVAFDKDKMTLRVPTHKAIEVGMRPLASPDVVAHAMAILRGKAKVKRAMWSRRAQEYEQKINSGDLIAIAEVVRDLHRTDDQREQSYSERQLYEAALEGRRVSRRDRNHRCFDVACGSSSQLELCVTPCHVGAAHQH
jgi:CarD family transcriptional regulator